MKTRRASAIVLAAFLTIACVGCSASPTESQSSSSRVQAGWGPERETFTMDKPADYATFNSITNAPSLGDERNFVRIGEIHKEKTNMVDEVEITPGNRYLVNIYYHNDASATFNDVEHDYKGVAQDTRVSSVYDKAIDANSQGAVAAVVTSKNANPTSVWDGATLNTGDEAVKISYEPNSAKIYCDGDVNGMELPDELFTKEGTLIGFNELNGTIPGCEEYRGVVSYVLVAE